MTTTTEECNMTTNTATAAKDLRHRMMQLLQYDPQTGVFTRRVDCSNSKAGAVAGSLHPDGYLQIALDGKRYLCHRLAWLYVRGDWPLQMIDHINGCRSDNRIANLRDVSRSVNMQNQKRAPSGKKSNAPLGVFWNPRARRWRSKIVVAGVRMDLGYFADQRAAHSAYIKAKRMLHEGNTL